MDILLFFEGLTFFPFPFPPGLICKMFLTAMSNSRCDVVTQCVSVSVCPCVPFFLMSLESLVPLMGSFKDD